MWYELLQFVLSAQIGAVYILERGDFLDKMVVGFVQAAALKVVKNREKYFFFANLQHFVPLKRIDR